MNKDYIFETLSILGAKKTGDSANFLKPSLYIKHKETGIKYTVSKIYIKKGSPTVICYRYYGPKNNKKVYIKLSVKDFNKFSPV